MCGVQAGQSPETVEQMHYVSMSDEALIEALRAGDCCAEDYLYEKYKHFIRSKSRTYFLVGADREDLIQEGMIGLYKAIRDYNPDKFSSFRTFAELCVTRQIITAIKRATRLKHSPLNTYISLNKPLSADGHERTLIDILSAASISDPEETVISQEAYETTAKRLKESLSKLECRSLMLFLEGRSYAEIAEELQRTQKAIDNALQRVRVKLEKQIWQK